MPADVAFEEGWVLISISKGLVVLSRQTFVDGLKRGKGWKRRAAMAQRMAEEGDHLAREPLLDHRSGE